MLSNNDPNFWEQRYQEGTTPWDLGQAAPDFISLLNSPSAMQPCRTAVLGCGRGYDAVLFADRGFEVIGFDFAASGIVDATCLAQETGSSAQFLQRDIFELAAEFPSNFDYIVEHTCFCAIPVEKRTSYVKLVHSLLRPGGELIALFFTHSRLGTPFGVTPVEIRKYFEDDFEILFLEPATNSVLARQGEEHFGRFRRI